MRIPRRFALLVLALAGLGWGSWYIVGIVRFERARASAERARAEFDFTKERDELGKCLRLRPNDAAIILAAASAARRDGDFSEAKQHLERYRQMTGRTTPEGLLQETLLRAANGPPEKDVEYLLALADRSEPRHPACEEILETLAVGSNHVYRPDFTRLWVDQLLKLYPRNAVGRLLRAQLDESMHKRERAEEECRRILEDFPAFDKARFFLASILSRRQRYDEALEEFQVLRERRPGDLAALLGAVGCLERLGRLDEARPLARNLEEQHGDKSEALLQAGRLAIREQRWPDAESLLDRAERISPYDFEVHKELAVCLYQLGRTDEARGHADRSREIESDRAKLEGLLADVVKAPRDPAPRVEAGRICLRNGQVNEGLRWLSGALEIAPDHKPTHEALAEYYAASGDVERAKFHRARAR
jgi:tetratricopeptide (TPR) repeat protein